LINATTILVLTLKTLERERERELAAIFFPSSSVQICLGKVIMAMVFPVLRKPRP
jgi:hypothetical protein